MSTPGLQLQLKPLSKQRGVATLAIGMIVLFLITLVTFSSFKVGQREQKISGSEYRYKHAFEAAQAGLEYGQMYLNEGKKSRAFDNWNWQSCADNPPTEWNATLASLCPAGTDASDPNDWIWFRIPDGNTVQPTDTSLRYQVFFVTADVDDPDVNDPDSVEDLQATIVSEGASDVSAGETAFDQTQTAYGFQRVVVHTEPILPGEPPAPLIVYGNVVPSGTFDAVTSPNGAGQGAPVTVWSRSSADFSSGTPATCQYHEFYENAQVNNPAYFYDASQSDGVGNTFNFEVISNDPTEDIVLCDSCTCPTDASGLTNSTNGENIDILDDDPNFPNDLFEFVFGIPSADYLTIKNDPNTVRLPDCTENNLVVDAATGETHSGLVWIEGNCHTPSNMDIGTPFEPILLVVEGEVKTNSNTRIFGMLYAFATDPATNTIDVDLNGGPEFYGALVIDRNIDLTNGGYSLIYQDKVLENLSNNLQKLGKVPGTWADYL